MNYLYLKNLEYYCTLGVFPEEWETPQPVIVNAKIYFDILKSGASDNIEDTLCYVSLHRAIEEIIKLKQYNLIEHMAHSIISKLKERFEVIQTINITVEKLQIPDDKFSGRVIASLEF